MTRDAAGHPAEPWEPCYCRVCGHVEWRPAGQSFPEDYRCPLCEARPAAFSVVSDPVMQRYGLALETLSDGLLCLRRQPRFSREWEHVSYAVRSAAGWLLFDPPPVYNAAVVEQVRSLGLIAALVISHQDFLSTAELWRQVLEVPVWMGPDNPLPGNRVRVDRRVNSAAPIDAHWHLQPLPGHSPGSIGLVGTTQDGQRTLVAGDALAVWDHPGDRRQVCIFETPGCFSDDTAKALQPAPDILACCTGWMTRASQTVEALLTNPGPSARPYLGETGGQWLDFADH